MTSPTILLTGLPDALAWSVAVRILDTCGDARLIALVRPDHLPGTRTRSDERFPADPRLELLAGDVTLPGFGLTRSELHRLERDVTSIFHLASCYHLGVDKRRVEEVNIEGTRHVLAFARRCSDLQRLHHLSTAFVCGDRRRVVLEDELEVGQHFRSTWERTRFVAELEVRRAMVDLPVTVYRPSTLVGDARSGELDRYEGPHFLIPLAVRHPSRLLRMLPRSLRSPVHVVPIDHVTHSILALGRAPASVGRTFHIVDPNPISLPHALRLITEHADQPDMHEQILHRLAAVVRHVPGLRSRGSAGLPVLHELDAPFVFNAMNTCEVLGGAGPVCPPLPAYVHRLVAAVSRAQALPEGTQTRA